MGPSVMTETILGSSLKEAFELLHFDTTLNEALGGIGKAGFRKGIELWKQYQGLKKRIEHERPDLMLLPLSQTPSGLLKDLRFADIAQKRGVPVVAHLHGGELDRTIERSPQALRSYLERKLKALHGVLVLREGTKDLFRPYLPEERILILPNGLRDPGRSEPPPPPPFRLLFLSNPIPRKGIEDLLHALISLKEKGRSVEAEVAGEWFDKSFEKKCKALAKEHELPIHFHAPKTGHDKKELFGRAHCFLLPPREPEGLPVALIEALGHGLPIITTPNGAVPDTVEEGVNGHVVPVKDPLSISERVEELMGDPSKRSLFGKKSRERYEAFFTEERFIENSYHCFESFFKMPPRG